MSNPFDDLSKDRIEAEEETRRRHEAESQRKERKRQINRRKYDLSVGYFEMVVGVLEQLRVAAYPNMMMRGSLIAGFFPEYDGEWQNDSWKAVWNISYRSEWHPGGSHWVSQIEVTLLYNEQGVPTAFECCLRENTPIKCGLSEAELINALKQLHGMG